MLDRHITFHPRASLGSRCRWVGQLLLVLFVLAVFFAPLVAGYGFFPIGRDTFPVFDDPPMIGAAEAEGKGLIFPRDAVIGVSHGGEAKAYPIAVMGIHELGNDSIGGIPIAVSW